jgi:phage shock protein C
MKKLYRSDTNKVFAGIIGGIGEYMEVDPVLLRVIWVVILLATGILPGVIAYFIAMLIVPKRRK